MKTVIVAAMLMACAAATPEHQRMFADFKSTHGRTYATEEEELKRFRVFSDNMKRAEELNRANPLARFGSNVFADMTAAEFKSRHNFDASRVPKSKESPITFGASAVRDATGQAIDWRTKGAVTPVKNQGACGSCWTFSTTGNIEGQWYLAGNPLTSLSEQELVSCDVYDYDNGCNGGTVYGALSWLMITQGGQIVTEDAYPYTSGTTSVDGNCSANLSNMRVGATVTGQRSIPSNENQMAAFVYSSGPLSIAVDATTWQTYTGGIVTNCTLGPVDHAVLITGFNDTEGSWTIKNTWGTAWGEAGYIRVQKGTNQCQLTKVPTTSIVGSISPPAPPLPTPTATTTLPPVPPTTSTPDLRGCNTIFPPSSFTIPMVYNQNQNATYDWLVSLSTPSTQDTPAGDGACASAVYLGQYAPGAANPVACFTQPPTKQPRADGSCIYTFSANEGTVYEITNNVIVMCDRNATTLQPPLSFMGTQSQTGLSLTGVFKSEYMCNNAMN